MQICFLILLFILGACFGSFLCCQARRLHLREKHKSSSKLNPRSICLHCHRQLRWYDNIPVISWIVLRGKCRHCHKPIGLAEILSELGLGLAFLALGASFDFNSSDIFSYLIFVLTLSFTLMISFLAIYDGLYGELPSTIIWISISTAFAVLLLQTCHTLLSEPFSIDLLWKPFASVAVLGGLYLVLYLVSHGKWVGDGDWLLGTAIAIFLANPWRALITLFLTNLLACFVMLPAMKRNRHRKIHLGPFMVAAFVIVIALFYSKYDIISLW